MTVGLCTGVGCADVRGGSEGGVERERGGEPRAGADDGAAGGDGGRGHPAGGRAVSTRRSKPPD